MKDNDVLQSIDTAYDESKCLLDSALLIKTNEINEDVRLPTSFMNSSFGMWLYTEGLSLAKHPWFNAIVEQHQLVYEGYSKLFHGAKKDIDISELFSDFDKRVHAYHEKLDEVKNEFCDNEPEPDLKHNIELKEETSSQVKNIETVIVDKSVASADQVQEFDFIADKGLSKTEALLEKLQYEKKVSIASPAPKKTHTPKPKSDIPKEYLSIHNELQNEVQNQLELKQELIEQELIQVKDRQKLFTKTINQFDYHSLLKERESKLAIDSYQDKFSQNSELKKKKESNLKEIQSKRENIQQDFEAMELASTEFEKINIHECVEDKEKVNQIDQELKQVAKDHNKVSNQQTKKKKILEDLKKRVQQAERELDSLNDNEFEISKAQELISNKKFKLQHEIEEKLVKQHQDREHYLQLEELKFQSLQRAKKQYYLTKQEILHLEHEQQNISQGQKESELLRLKEIKQLQEQRDLKQQMLDVLEVEYEQKEGELKSIRNEQEKIQIDSEIEIEKLFSVEA